MIKVSNEYNMVLEILQNDGDTSNLPDEYGKILQNNTLKHKKDKAQKAIDDSITDYTALLQRKLKKIGYETSILTVLWSNFFNKEEIPIYPAAPEANNIIEQKDNNELNNYKKKK